MLSEKIEESARILKMIGREYKNPILYSGMGKDSVCLIHLSRHLGFKWDVMFHRDPYFPWKYNYANWLISQWNLICRDYPAHRCTIFYMNDTFEVVRHFAVGTGDMVLCAMLYEPEELIEGEYLCGLKDIYHQPKGSIVKYEWDIGLQGHKASECKPHSGMKPNMLQWPMKHCFNGPDWAQPLQDWTEEDVYEYFVLNAIPVNTNVYDVRDERLVPKEDSTFNPDRRPACFRCMKPSDSPVEFCPKKQVVVNNVYSKLDKIIMPDDFPMY